MSDSTYSAALSQANLVNANNFAWNQFGAAIDSQRSWKYTKRAMALQHDYNIDAAQRTFDYNLQAWNLENEYNSPAAQMQRYKSAGLNPLLIYGNQQPGASFGASPVSGSSLGSVNTRPGSTYDLGSTINVLQNMIMNQKQLQLIDANIARVNASASEIAARTSGYKIKQDLNQFDLDFKNNNKDTLSKRLENQSNYFNEMYLWNKMRREQYMDTGIDISDGILSRLLARVIQSLGFSIDGVVEGTKRIIKTW